MKINKGITKKILIGFIALIILVSVGFSIYSLYTWRRDKWIVQGYNNAVAQITVRARLGKMIILQDGDKKYFLEPKLDEEIEEKPVAGDEEKGNEDEKVNE